MANMCNNDVTITGKEENVKAFFAELLQLEEINKTGGALPKYAEEKGLTRYLFDIYIDQKDNWDGRFSTQTKWSPPIDEIREMAECHNVDAEMDYEELGNGIYGKWTYAEGNENDIYLDDVDFAKVFWREEEEDCIFEGKEYESEYEPLQVLLERKINGSEQFATSTPRVITDTPAIEFAFDEMLGNPIAEIDEIVESLKPLKREYDKAFARAEDLILQNKMNESKM